MQAPDEREHWRDGGAIDISEAACPQVRRYGRSRVPLCRCERCAFCGGWKHTAAHGAVYGQPPGSKPWGHAFVPIGEADSAGRGRP